MQRTSTKQTNYVFKSWSGDVSSALNHDPTWQMNKEDSQALVEHFCRSLRMLLRQNIRGVINRRMRGPVVEKRICCAEGIWKHFIWDRLLEHEKTKPPKKSSKVYQAELMSLHRVAAFFGKEALCKHFATGARSFICPRALVVRNTSSTWSCAGLGSLQLRKGEFIAVLGYDPQVGLGYGWQWREDEKCDLLGMEVNGRVGYFPVRAVKIEDPVHLRYSGFTGKLTVRFTYFPFSRDGDVTTAKFNLAYLRQQ